LYFRARLPGSRWITNSGSTSASNNYELLDLALNALLIELRKTDRRSSGSGMDRTAIDFLALKLADNKSFWQDFTVTSNNNNTVMLKDIQR